MNSELKNIIVSSYEAGTPDSLDYIKEKIRNTQMLDEEVTVMPIKRKSKLTKGLMSIASLVAATLIFISGMVYGNNRIKSSLDTESIAVTDSYVTERSVNSVGTDTELATLSLAEAKPCVAMVYIDVNPSIKLAVDEDYLVLECDAANADAKAIMDGSEVVGLNVNVAFKYIVGCLYMNGYLQGNTDAMLVSVDAKEEHIYDDISLSINRIMNETKINSEVISQTVETEVYIKAAEELSISVGKMELVDKVIETGVKTAEDAGELSKYSIRALENLLKNIENGSGEQGESNSNPPPVEATLNTTEKIVDETFDTITDVLEETGEIVGEITEGVSDIIDTLISPQLP